jgi:hypothetical protein
MLVQRPSPSHYIRGARILGAVSGAAFESDFASRVISETVTIAIVPQQSQTSGLRYMVEEGFINFRRILSHFRLHNAVTNYWRKITSTLTHFQTRLRSRSIANNFGH